MKHCLLFLLLCCAQLLNAQLSCKTKTLGDGSSEKTCLHKNGKASTVETWDKDQRFGKIVVYSNNGTEIFNRSLRRVGGHASAHLEYYANGQVSKIEFSDAPDGGIQFYNSTTKFDENGKQTEFYETKYPFELEVVTTQPLEYPQKRSNDSIEKSPNQEVVKCASIAQTCYEIQNATTATLTIRIVAVPNNTVLGQSKEIKLKPSQKVVFDTLFTAERPISEKIYSVELIAFNKSKKNKKLKVIEPGPIDQPNGPRVYYWFITKDD